MTVDERNIIWLSMFEFLSYQKKIDLLKLTEKGTDIRKDFIKNEKYSNVLDSSDINRMSLCLADNFFDRKYEEFTRDGVKLVTFYSPEYPYLLKEIPSAPLLLFCKGNLQLLNSYCVGVVGSRKASEYGLVVTRQFVKTLVDNDITIVSGMATGIDTIAHKTALENGGNTIAVLAGGFNNIYPKINTNLSKQIAESNLLITENPPDTPSLNYLFPIRNRIIAGLSHGVLVTEAGENSGSLHTVNYAVEFNREVFAVPGRINSAYSMGTNRIIKEMQASCTTCVGDILNSLKIEKKEKTKNSSIQLDMQSQIVLNYIQTEKKSFQELCDLTGISARELNALLVKLELTGMVTKLANNSYIKS